MLDKMIGQVLKNGAKGEAVEKIQDVLTKVGIDTGPIDGLFGPKTEGAVKVLQDKLGIKIDGVVGPETLGAIGKMLKGSGAPAFTAGAMQGKAIDAVKDAAMDKAGGALKGLFNK